MIRKRKIGETEKGRNGEGEKGSGESVNGGIGVINRRKARGTRRKEAQS